MSKNKKEKIIVYWSPWSVPERTAKMMLIDFKPISLMSDIQKRRAKNPTIPQSISFEGGNYQACSALHTFAKNMFILKSPISAEIELDENGTIIRDSAFSDWFIERISSIENAFSVDLDIGWLFFSEETLSVEITSPYMHKTAYQDYGFTPAAQMDISSWLRPVPAIFQLWENVKKIKIKENEPILYIKFDTDKEIEFKRFIITPGIFNKSIACTEHKKNFKFQTLEKLYKMFNSNGLKDQVLKEIKENVI
jgi:hypothetical protein